MIKVEHIDVYGWHSAIRGMRNPMNSWEKSDTSTWDEIGNADMKLMKKLVRGGSEHRKFMRQIYVSMDITAPLYWWKEFDTYKVGTTANSCSTMHKLMEKPFTREDFSFEKLEITGDDLINERIEELNYIRETYMNYDSLVARGKLTEGIDKKTVWYTLVELLPSAYNQKRTVTMNYEVAYNMIQQRSGHKLDEWREFVSVLLDLPNMEKLTDV